MKPAPTMLIGIDPGTNTGVAVYDRSEKRLVGMYTIPIHQAMELVAEFQTSIHVIVEDARKIKLPRHLQQHKGTEYLRGVGSICRDCTIWEDFLTDLKISHEMKDPRTTKKKMDKALWYKITGYKGQTSEHARDASLLVWNK